MKNNYLRLFSRVFGILFILICTLISGVTLVAQEVVRNSDSDSDGILETTSYEMQRLLQDYSPLLDTGEIVHFIDAPGGNSQGLTWDGTHLWVSDISTNMIYQVDPINGMVNNSFSSPGESSEGLAWDGNNLWVTDNGGGPFEPDFLYNINPADGTIISTLDLESMSWPHGITWDGQYIWTVNFGPKS